MKANLEEARVVIDTVDREIASLFEKRMQAVETVVAYKKEHNLPILDAAREQQVIEKNMAFLQREEYKPFYRTYLQHMMELSKQYQKTLIDLPTVGYQGTEGAFSHLAAKHLFSSNPLKPFATFEDVFLAVQNGTIAYGVIPFENSYTGEVGEVLDLLKQYDVFINEIYDQKVNQNLLVLPGTSVNDIRQVYSHHQAIGQCKLFLRSRSFEVIPYPNTALAAKYVSECKEKHKAAIASKETAELYGLEVLAANINTAVDNTTRFIVLSERKESDGNRFNMLFTVDNAAGQLAKIINLIAHHGFNMESIRSRSLKDVPWEYYFYAEIEGSLKSLAAKELVADLKNHCKEIKILGTYQR